MKEESSKTKMEISSKSVVSLLKHLKVYRTMTGKIKPKHTNN